MATVTDEVKTFFTADLTGLESADRKQEAMSRKAIARERASNREFKAMAEERRRASQAVANGITNPMGAAADAVGGLVGKLKGVGVAGGVAFGALALGFKILTDARKSIEASADAMKELNEQFRVASRGATFSSAGEGVSSLAARLRGNADLEKKVRDTEMERDPYGFGTGKGGTAMTTISKMMQPAYNFFSDPSGMDREEREKADLELNRRVAAQQNAKIQKEISEFLSQDLAITRERLSGDAKEAEILALQLGKVKAINDAKALGLNLKEQDKIGAGFDLQEQAIREQQDADRKHFFAESAALGLKVSNLSVTQKNAREQLAIIKNGKAELAGRQLITQERQRELQLQIMGAQGNLTQARRDTMFGKTPAQIKGDVVAGAKTKTVMDKFDATTAKNDGLVEIHYGMDGQILSGLDPLTGERRKPSASYRPGPKLTTGGLNTGSLRTMDDETPYPFDDTPFGNDPGARLNNPGAAGFGDPGGRLSNPGAAGFGDPGERLRGGRAGKSFLGPNTGMSERPGSTGGSGLGAAAAQVSILNTHTPILQRIANKVENLGLK